MPIIFVNFHPNVISRQKWLRFSICRSPYYITEDCCRLDPYRRLLNVKMVVPNFGYFKGNLIYAHTFWVWPQIEDKRNFWLFYPNYSSIGECSKLHSHKITGITQIYVSDLQTEFRRTRGSKQTWYTMTQLKELRIKTRHFPHYSGKVWDTTLMIARALFSRSSEPPYEYSTVRMTAKQVRAIFKPSPHCPLSVFDSVCDNVYRFVDVTLSLVIITRRYLNQIKRLNECFLAISNYLEWLKATSSKTNAKIPKLWMRVSRNHIFARCIATDDGSDERGRIDSFRPTRRSAHAS